MRNKKIIKLKYVCKPDRLKIFKMSFDQATNSNESASFCNSKLTAFDPTVGWKTWRAQSLTATILQHFAFFEACQTQLATPELFETFLSTCIDLEPMDYTWMDRIHQILTSSATSSPLWQEFTTLFYESVPPKSYSDMNKPSQKYIHPQQRKGYVPAIAPIPEDADLETAFPPIVDLTVHPAPHDTVVPLIDRASEMKEFVTRHQSFFNMIKRYTHLISKGIVV